MDQYVTIRNYDAIRSSVSIGHTNDTHYAAFFPWCQCPQAWQCRR